MRNNQRVRRSLIPIALVAAALALAGPAQAAPPTALKVSQNGGIVSASWRVASGMLTGWLEFAPTTVSDETGAFTDAAARPFQFYDPQTRFKSSSRFPPGSYFAHVSAISAQCDDIEVPCVNEWTSPLAFKVPAGSALRFSKLRVARRQALTKLMVRAAIPRSGKIAVRGTISVPGASRVYRLKAVSAAASAGKTVKVRVKAARKALRAARKALVRHAKVKARLTVTARDGAGNTTSAKRSVTLRR
jgi:hypothetical protein